MGKRKMVVIGGIVGVIILMVVLMILQREKIEKYTNLFEYVIDLENEEWTYAPARLEFGMSMKEVLAAEKLDESAIMEDDSEVVFVRQKLTSISENIDQMELAKRFVVAENYGLIGAEYQLLVDEADFEEVCSTLYKQAVSYMPEDEQASVEGIKDGKGVLWRSYDEKNILKSCVSFSTDAIYDLDHSKRIVSLSVYIEPSYLRTWTK